MKLHSTIFSPKSCLSTHNSINNMTEILQSPPSHLPSTSSSSNPCGRITSNDGSHSSSLLDERVIEEEEGEVRDRKRKERDREGDQLSILTLLVSAFRKSWIGCSASGGELSSMEIGWPSNVSHVAHVTFDRFHGFLGLPVEFEPEVPRRAPSASASVFGVSTESMQLSFDTRGNSVPTILLLLQRQLYAQGGLQAEGIFRINAENGQEEYVREQLNRGVVPSGVDVHCLAGLIKAWFRELPSGVLDPLSPEQVMQSQSEEECAQLVRLLPPTEAALLDWAINLMADVAQLENLNKMSARNIAMVFAPNMTQMADPLTALMYAVQVMNFLKTLVIKTLREREESMVETNPISNLDSFDDDWHQSPSCLDFKDGNEGGNETSEEEEKVIVTEELSEDGSETESGSKTLPISAENIISQGNRLLVDSCPCNVISQVTLSGLMKADEANICLNKNLPLSRSNTLKYSEKVIELPLVGNAERNMVIPIFGRINSRTEWTEAWR